MKCLICGNASWVVKHCYSEPDKYEKWQHIDNVMRSWLRCTHCGFHHQTRNYPLELLEGIYDDGYRNEGFRGKNISDAFYDVWELPPEKSENHTRLGWYVAHCGAKEVADIGSGLGVWPALLKQKFHRVVCFEANTESIDWIRKLGLQCYKDFKDHPYRYDCVSLIHVLEHIDEPDSFLADVKRMIMPGGYIFVEVPDASEFGYLGKNDDEFNSCHCYFYDVPSLYRLLERNGYVVSDIHRQFYSSRGLTRLMAVAQYHEIN